MYQKILSRLKAEGLMDEEPGEDDGEENDSGSVVRRKAVGSTGKPQNVRNRFRKQKRKTGPKPRNLKRTKKSGSLRKQNIRRKRNGSKKETDRRPGKILWFQKKAVKAAGRVPDRRRSSVRSVP